MTGKPSTEFPLWWRKDKRCHSGGYWCKTIGGRHIGLGPDADKALKRYREFIRATGRGENPALTYSTATIADAYSAFVDHQHGRAEDGEIQPREFADRRRHLDHFCAFIGESKLMAELRPEHFTQYREKLRQRYGPVSITKRVWIVKKMFAHAAECDLLEHPMKFGASFRPPSRKAMAKAHKQAKAKKTPYTRRQVRRLLCRAPQPLKAMAWLGINCCFGPTDLGKLPLDRVRLWIERDPVTGRVTKAGGFHDFPRPKNDAIERACYLWPETALALEEWLRMRDEMIKRRRPPKDVAGLVFFTRHRQAFARDRVERDPDGRIAKVVPIETINREWRTLCNRLGFPTGFYRLRHTAATWLSNVANDSHAECRIRGHYLPGMSRRYVHKIDGKRVRRIVRRLRAKLRGWKRRKSPPALIQSGTN